MFRRRDTRPLYRVLAEAVWPRGGWSRAFQYIKLRLRRLPGTPEEIARGVFAGILVTFTPLYGFHFIMAAVLAKIMRGRILAALLATFFGNPLTFPPIAVISLRLGYYMLGMPVPPGLVRNAFRDLRQAGREVWQNIKAIFTPERANWDGVTHVWDTVFFPWMVGAIIPGVLFGLIGYLLTAPVIRAYQARRSARLRKKMEKLQAQAGAAARDS